MKLKMTLTAAFMSMATFAHAQIPVTDAAHIAKNAAQHIETIARWKSQYDQMVGQLNQLKSTYQSMTGTRSLGQILNSPALREYLPSDWQKVYDSVKSGGYNGLSGSAKALYDASKIFDSCQHLSNGQQRTLCEARAVKGAQDKAFALDAYDKAKSRLNQIDQLMAKINQTSDPKAIAELQGRIAGEQAMIQNEQTKLQLYKMVAEAEDRMQQQQQRELQARTWSARTATDAAPLTFNR